MICQSNNKQSNNCAKCVVKKKTIFNSLSDNEISKISEYIEKTTTYRVGEYLIKEYEKAHYSLCVNSGYLILGTYLKDGSRQIFKVVFPGDSIGFSNNHGDYGYFVQAVTDVDVCVINDLSVKKLLKEHGDVALRLVEILANNSNLYQQYLVNLGRKTAREALAYLIMELSIRIKEHELPRVKNKDDLCFFPLNQEGMADMLGLTKVHVSRVISQFKKEGLINYSHKKLKVLNEDKLASIAAFTIPTPE